MGFTVYRHTTLPKDFVEVQGYELEEKYLKAFPELKKLKKNDEKALKIEVLNKVVAEYPTHHFRQWGY
ncbi:hypothetical protein I6I98_13245 [Sphingobacterium multivorum]|uniref:Uncharacterized protein n=1 Tax=Sphingobacterium multivorum TaxID=28454 RepID=A0ABX7CZ37_SPHMU|nr:hypothetical protein [Sphingobacterium multivorum]QQT56166.1 hypothetical protein I6I98_13245 [Sphingobacterium multivorum]